MTKTQGTCLIGRKVFLHSFLRGLQKVGRVLKVDKLGKWCKLKLDLHPSY